MLGEISENVSFFSEELSKPKTWHGNIWFEKVTAVETSAQVSTPNIQYRAQAEHHEATLD